MARIALTVPAIVAHGGVVSVADFLLKTLRERTDHDVRLISLAMSSRDPASILVRAPRTWLRGVRVHRGNFRGTPFDHVGARWAEMETQRYQPRAALDALLAGCDMVQVVAGTPAWAWPFHRTGLPVSLQVASLIEVERKAKASTWTGAGGLWRRWMLSRLGPLENRALAHVDAIQVENRWMEDHVRSHAAPGCDIRFAPPGVDMTLFCPARGTRDGGYLLSVGRLSDPRKNHRLLLEAYRQLAVAHPDAPRLILAGPDRAPDWMGAFLENHALSDRVVIEHAPPTDRLAALYAGADAFVLASDEEGFGVTVIEAMSTARPVISTRSGGPDGIIEDGVDGFLVTCGDAEGLAKRMADLLEAPSRADAMGRAARAKVEARYSQAAAGTAFVEAIEAVLDRQGSR